MVIRNYQPGDFPQIEALWKKTGIFKLERGDTAEMIEQCNEQGGKFLIMEEKSSKRVVGTSWLTWDGRRVLMHHLAVLPSMQKRGYGRKLAEESLAFSREKKSPLKLEVNRHNLPAVQLYSHLGFKVFENYEVYIIYQDS
jgi:ribosomal protein S18 acetylase RimI-like enzyme